MIQSHDSHYFALKSLAPRRRSLTVSSWQRMVPRGGVEGLLLLTRILLILDFAPAPIYFTPTFGARAATPERLFAIGWLPEAREWLATVRARALRQDQPKD